jgi:hypothetical protein
LIKPAGVRMRSFRLSRWSLLALGAALVAAPAIAEVIEITGEFPAQYREASFLGSLHVERFTGQDGPQLALAVERALANGAPFALVGGRAGRGGAEGTMSGAVSTGVEENPWKRKDKKCVERDDKKKCIKEEEVEVRCTRRVVNFSADLRIVRNADGQILYSRNYPFRDELSWCQGETPYRTVEEAVAGAIRDIAGSVRREVAPVVQTYRIRLRESTKGMAKDQAKAFKALIKSSQRDMAGACGQWQAMNQAAPGNPSLLYNLALCAEQRGDYEGAGTLYRDAQRAGAKEGADGASRATRLIAGREDAKERARRRRQ